MKILVILILLAVILTACGVEAYYGQIVAVERDYYFIANMYRGSATINRISRRDTNYRVGDCVSYSETQILQVVLCTDMFVR